MNECSNYKLSVTTSISFLSIITGIIYFSAYKTGLYNKKMQNKMNSLIESNKEIIEKLNKITTFVSVYDFKKLEIKEFPNYNIVDNINIPPTPPTQTPPSTPPTQTPPSTPPTQTPPTTPPSQTPPSTPPSTPITSNIETIIDPDTNNDICDESYEKISVDDNCENNYLISKLFNWK